MTWNDVTYDMYREITLIMQDKEQSDEEKTYDMIKVLYGEDVLSLSLPEFAKKVDLSFLKTKIPDVGLLKEYEVNGHKYKLYPDLSKLSVAQYLDFNNYTKTGNNDMRYVLSVFFIPEGHTYNDGYDMEEVHKDIGDMPMPLVSSVCFFFRKWSVGFAVCFRRSSLKEKKRLMKAGKITKEEYQKYVQMYDAGLTLTSLFLLS